MADEFCNDILKKVVAQICQLIGFDRTMTTPLLVLSDLLKRFISDLGRKSQHYSEHCGRTTLTLTDLDLTFRDFHICPRELYEFLTHVGPLPESPVVPKFPVDKRHFDTLTIYENTPLLHKNLLENTLVLQMNPLQESEYPLPSSFEISETIEHLNFNVPQPLKIEPLIDEPLKIEIPKEPIKIKISLKKINCSGEKKGIKKHKIKKKKKPKSKK